MTILVTGGTGTLGQPLVAQLRAQGAQVRVLTRKTQSGNDWATGDLTKGAGLAAALDGVHTIVHCATTLGKADIRATQHLIDAAKAAGGRPHFVYISIVGIDETATYFYYKTKLACEQLIADSGLPWTILRATQFHDLIVKLFDIQRRLPVLFSLAKISDQPIATSDTARRLTELALGEPAGRAADIGGPEIHTFDELARLYLAATGRKRKIVRLPIPGKTGRACRAGSLLTPANRYGTVTFAQHLAAEVKQPPQT